MPATCVRKFGSTTFEMVRSLEYSYTIQDAEDEDDAATALFLAAPATLWGLTQDGLRVEEEGDGLWTGIATYSRADQVQDESQEPGDAPRYTFDTTGGTFRRTHSISTISKNGRGDPEDTPLDFKGAINATKDGVEGVDIGVSIFKFSETYTFEAADITEGYKVTLSDMTHTTNDAPFRGHAAGEVLFLGASGSTRGDGKYEITFHFAALGNELDIEIFATATIDVAAKGGHEYLWVYYEDAEDTAGQGVVKRAQSAYVEQVYYPWDFDDLER